MTCVCLKMCHDSHRKLAGEECHRALFLARSCCSTSAAADLLTLSESASSGGGREGGTSLGIQRSTSNRLITPVPLDQTEDKNRQENKQTGLKFNIVAFPG